ncbi:HlyD family efflux transporter periplasmic adaptor subunit [Erwinia typographi]|uniref:HlyD family efflux transporter periplasmic adaptor subunit n=1 Tax=Erwinia typographi TaxID=371042 RepID=UPI000A045E1F|nr:HlyD family efflux transporter periplasmic adaptor subunit [Erwinia typographi]
MERNTKQAADIALSEDGSLGQKENTQGEVKAADLPYIRDLQQALLNQKSHYSLVVLWLMIIFIILLLVWANFARVEEIVRGEGSIIPAQRGQVIQSLEGGTLQALLVREGDVVEQGAVLLRLDPLRADAWYREGRSKILGLEGTIARLRAETYDLPLSFPEEVRGVDSIVNNETQVWQARKQALAESILSLQKSLKLVEHEINLSEPLMKKGLMSEVELLRMKRQKHDFNLQIMERKSRFRAEANADLNRLESELWQTRENVIAREDAVRRTTLTAPVKGTVNNIRVTTTGGIIQAGAEIMTLTPLDDSLLIEAKISPQDVAFLRPGQPVTVKISAYDYAIYGGLEGRLEQISADTLKDEDKLRQGRPDATYYRVYVRTVNTSLKVKEKEFPILPGMIASIEIKTGEKSILDYLLKPVLKAREAFRER